ncbi:MAG: adenosylcobinamide-GDP ribazoletransferase [Microcystaceae cyanobacterium]
MGFPSSEDDQSRSPYFTLQTFLGAILFYTAIPLPNNWSVSLARIARWSPMVGLLIGGCLAIAAEGLAWLGFSPWVSSGLIVALWVGITGGLHLDGVSDTADGLAVVDPEQRLTVMQDSRTGAFGVMAIALVLLLKTLGLAEIHSEKWFCLLLATGWSRWGQVAAIAFYPYLKKEGKGARHKQNFKFPQDLLWGLFLLLGLSGIWVWQKPELLITIGEVTFSCAAIALLLGKWFGDKLGGHTGDSYGAIVEWSEALILCVLTLVFG